MIISSSHSEADMEVIPVIWGSCYSEITVQGTGKFHKVHKENRIQWPSW